MSAFEGYQARLVNGPVVWVVNRNDQATIRGSSETVAALKVRERVLVGWQGWSGGSRPAYSWKAARWVRASLVSHPEERK